MRSERVTHLCPCGCETELQSRNGLRYMLCLASWREVPVELRSTYEKARSPRLKAIFARRIIDFTLAKKNGSPQPSDNREAAAA